MSIQFVVGTTGDGQADVQRWLWPSLVLPVTIYKRAAWDSSSSQASGFTRMADCKAFLFCTLTKVK